MNLTVIDAKYRIVGVRSLIRWKSLLTFRVSSGWYTDNAWSRDSDTSNRIHITMKSNWLGKSVRGFIQETKSERKTYFSCTGNETGDYTVRVDILVNLFYKENIERLRVTKIHACSICTSDMFYGSVDFPRTNFLSLNGRSKLGIRKNRCTFTPYNYIRLKVNYRKLIRGSQNSSGRFCEN